MRPTAMDLTSRYNEVADASGRIRPAFAAFAARTGLDPRQPSPDTVRRLGHRPLGDDYTILPIPLVLDEAEYRAIASGVRQRALALQSLFHDLVNAGQVPPFGASHPRAVCAALLHAQGIDLDGLRRWWRGKPREQVRFAYAPDLLRGPDGAWVVLEDNVGCVGGLVDAPLVVDAYCACSGASTHPQTPRDVDLPHAIRAFLSRVNGSAEHLRVVALAGCQSDPEGPRRRQALVSQALEVMTDEELRQALPESADMRAIDAVVNFDGSMLRSGSARQPDASTPAEVQWMTAPGVELLGNKAFLPLTDAIIAQYSGTAPTLRTAPTTPYREMPGDPRGLVLKESRGRQGREVHFLDAMPSAEHAALAARLSSHAGAGAVLQSYVAGSFVPVPSGESWAAHQVELRPIAWIVGDGTCLVADAFSGRGFVNRDGRTAGNMSRGASYIAVMRELITTHSAGRIHDTN